MIGSTRSSLYPSGSSNPFIIRSHSSYLISNIPSRTVPAVVVIIDIGCSLAVIPSTITSYKFLSSMACNSSITLACTLSPSKVLESLDKGLKDPSLKSVINSDTRDRTLLFKMGDFLIILLDSSQTILAWSRLVATDTISGPASPSAINKYRPTALAHADFPFFLATIKINSRYFLVPSILWTNPNKAPVIAFCHNSNLKDLPPIFPFECLQNFSTKSIAWLALFSSYSYSDSRLSKSLTNFLYTLLILYPTDTFPLSI